MTLHAKAENGGGFVKRPMPGAIRQAHKLSIGNREIILAGARAACFNCRQIFAPSQITEWTDAGKTALCPSCGIDAVLPETPALPITSQFLNAMNRHWFAT